MIDEPKPTMVPLVAFLVLSLLAGTVSTGLILMGVMSSESAGVTASMALCPVVGASLLGGLGAVLGTVLSKSTGVRVAVPIVAGLVGLLGSFVAVFFFYAVIWPMT